MAKQEVNVFLVSITRTRRKMEVRVGVRGLLGIPAYYLKGGGEDKEEEKEQRLGCRKKKKRRRILKGPIIQK